jgi:hypothetical protein
MFEPTTEVPRVHSRRRAESLRRPLLIGAAVVVVLLGGVAWTTLGRSSGSKTLVDGLVGAPASSSAGSAVQSGSAGPSPSLSPGASASAGPSASTSASAKPSVSTSIGGTATRAPAPPPKIPSGSTLCGASFSTAGGSTYMQTLSQEESMIGNLHAIRVFYPGQPAAWPGNAGNVDRTVVVSFKFNPSDVIAGREDAYMRTWFADAPRDHDIYWSYYHEAEDQIADGTFTAAEYRAAWTHLKGLANDAGNSRLHSTLILMAWSVNPASGRNWKDYYAGNSVIDVIGWDVYNTDDKKGTYTPASTLLNGVIAASGSVGKPWGVAELGSPKMPSDPSGAARADWLASIVTGMQHGHALWAAYFDLNWDATHDYRLRDTASQNVWRSFCNSAG